MGHDRSNNGLQSVCVDKKVLNKYFPAVKKVLGFILAQWLVIGFGLSCLLAYFFPSKHRTEREYLFLLPLSTSRGTRGQAKD